MRGGGRPQLPGERRAWGPPPAPAPASLRPSLQSLVGLPGQVVGGTLQSARALPPRPSPRAYHPGSEPGPSEWATAVTRGQASGSGAILRLPPAPYGMSRGPLVPASMSTHPCWLDLKDNVDSEDIRALS